jgi:hypothetical protein
MKVIGEDKINDNTTIVAYDKNGFWLWDETRQMNLSVRAKTRDAAIVEALSYYQKRFAELEKKHKDLSKKVEAFVGSFKSDDSEEE